MADTPANPPSHPNDSSEKQDQARAADAAPGTPASAPDAICPQCMYNLRGIDSERCPECGYSIDFRNISEPQLPWLQRHEIGSVRAYWRTVRTAIVRKKKFWEEISRPVSHGDAQRFRWITVVVTYLPLIPLSLALIFDEPDAPFAWLMENEPGVFAVGIIVVHSCALLFLAGATGLPTYFFHPKRIPIEQQNRAVALSYYCCAPLAWLPIMYLPMFAVIVLMAFDLLEEDSAVGDIAALSTTLWAMYFSLRIVIEWSMGLCWLHRRATGSETVRYGLFFALLPSLWLVLGGILLVGVPLLVGYVALVISSVW